MQNAIRLFRHHLAVRIAIVRSIIGRDLLRFLGLEIVNEQSAFTSAVGMEGNSVGALKPTRVGEPGIIQGWLMIGKRYKVVHRPLRFVEFAVVKDPAGIFAFVGMRAELETYLLFVRRKADTSQKTFRSKIALYELKRWIRILFVVAGSHEVVFQSSLMRRIDQDPAVFEA